MIQMEGGHIPDRVSEIMEIKCKYLDVGGYVDIIS